MLCSFQNMQTFLKENLIEIWYLYEKCTKLLASEISNLLSFWSLDTLRLTSLYAMYIELNSRKYFIEFNLEVAT